MIRQLLVGKFLHDSLVGAPRTLAKEVLDNFVDEVNKERLVTEDSIKERLQQLLLMLQNGEIDEEEYDKLEADLMERLKAVREYENGGQ